MNKIFYILVVFATLSLGAEEYDKLYRGSRPMGMGGAFTAISDDENALFYNPAGLNRIKPGEGKIVLLNPMLVLNRPAMDVINKISDKLTKDPIDALSPHIGQNMHANLMTSMPYWVRHNFGLAVMFPNVTNNTTLRRNIALEAKERAIIDSGLLVSMSHGFLQDRLSVGATLKFLVRGAGDVTMNAVQLYTKKGIAFKDIGGYGFGVDADLGAMYTFNKVAFFIPTIAMSINNIGATKFPTRFEDSGYDLPDSYRLKRSLSLGSKFELPNAWRFTKWLVAFDINDIGLGGSLFKKIHLGTEAWLFDFFGLRGGINQGYLTFGLTLDIPVMQVDFYTYAEELGNSVGTKGDRRIGVQLSFGW
jgi:hypothetical protein